MDTRFQEPTVQIFNIENDVKPEAAIKTRARSNAITKKKDTKITCHKKKKRHSGSRKSVTIPSSNYSESEISILTPPSHQTILPIISNKTSDDSSGDSQIGILLFKDKLLTIIDSFNVTQKELDELLPINTQAFPYPPEISFDSDNTIISATFTQLIIALTDPNKTDVDFQNNFLISFPSYSEPKKVLAALYLRFFINIHHPDSNIKDKSYLSLVQNRIIRIMSKWMSSFQSHFTDPMILSFDKFLDAISDNKSLAVQHQIIQNALKRLRGERQRSIVYRDVDPPPMKLPKTPERDWIIVNIPPEELARQVTLLHSSFYRAIEPGEILSSIWGSKMNYSNNSNFKKLINHFDSFSTIVVVSILSYEETRERAEIHSFWIDVCKYCRRLNNFHALFSVITGLQHPAIKRLKETVELSLKSKSKRKTFFEQAIALCSNDDNYGNYRNALTTVQQPCIPFVGCFQRDLIYIHEMSPDIINGMINLHKCNEAVKVLVKMSEFQSCTYPFQSHPKIQEIITKIPNEIKNETLMRISMQREAKK
ncbi:RasGEF domain containing protein [Histomonas meleagridis]|uniref:RasGEF domain containing protein n=1 Tax=Histomonas meleagridis TaxID=135588 RepID=UPI003559B060|nr:RasGEF domain containing protein [Histomonas meleagridis]KAH0797123.1 RasGEF domain containing protein [Histomonas meleagridis]